MANATIQTLKELRSCEAFKNLLNEAEILARSALIPLPSEQSQSEPKRRRLESNKLHDFIVLSSTGSRESQSLEEHDSCRRVFHEIIDNFSTEISDRLVQNDDIYRLLEVSDPSNINFLDEGSVRAFCFKFSRFQINVEAIVPQLKVAKNLLLTEKFTSPLQCLDFLIPLKDGFKDVVLFFKVVLTFPVSSASCERSFSALKRIKSYLRSTIGATRTSALFLLSIERDLTETLSDDPEPVIDVFARTADRRLSLVL